MRPAFAQAGLGQAVRPEQRGNGLAHRFPGNGFLLQQLGGDVVQRRTQALQQAHAFAVELAQQGVGGVQAVTRVALDAGVTDRLQAQQRAARPHPQRADHRQCQAAGFLQILGGSGGGFVEMQQLGAASGEEHADARAQLGFQMQALVFHRSHQGHAEGLAARQNGDLLDPADLECGSDQRVTSLVHRDPGAVAGRRRRCAFGLLADAVGFQCIDEMRHRDFSGTGAGGEQRGLVGDRGDGGRAETDAVARQRGNVQLAGTAQLGRVQLEQRLAIGQAGQADVDAAIEATFAQQCRVEGIGEVGRAQQQYALAPGEAVQLGEELIDDAVALGVAGAGLLAALADAVDLVDEDDARCLAPGAAEQCLDLLDADAEVHRGEVAAGDLDEAGAALGGQGLGQLGLAGAGRAGQQYALGRPGAEARVTLRITQAGTDVHQCLLGFMGADHVAKTDAGALLLGAVGPQLQADVAQRQQADQQEGPELECRLVPGRLAVGIHQQQGKERALAAGVLLHQHVADASRLVGEPIVTTVVAADEDCLVAQRGAGNGVVAQIGEQGREVLAVVQPGLARVFQGHEHGLRRLAGGNCRHAAAMLPPECGGGQAKEHGEAEQHGDEACFGGGWLGHLATGCER